MEIKWFERLNNVIEYIEENLSGKISYKEISRISLCHVNLLQQFFTLNTGITLTEYIRRRRISEAAREVRQADSDTITGISYRYGYESSDAFRVAFKRYYGITPQEARRSKAKLKLYPQFSFNITVVYEEREDFMDAVILKEIKELEQKIKFEPQTAKYCDDLAGLYNKIKNYQKSHDYALQALELEPENAEYLRSYGNGLGWLGRWEEAIEYLTKAIEKDESKSKYYYDRGCLYLHLYHDLNMQNPTQGDTWNCEGYLKALEDFNKSLELEPANADCLIGIGECYYYIALSGKNITGGNAFAKPLEYFSRAIELDPDNPEIYFNRANTYAYKGDTANDCIADYKRAIEDYSRVIALDPNNSAAYFSRGCLYANMGEFNEAREDAEKALELDPDNEAYQNLVNEMLK